LYTVIGVVQDFHYDFFFEEIQPVLIRLVPEDALNYLVARVNAGTGTQSATAFKGIWQKLFPDSVFDIVFQDSVFEQAYRNNVTITKIFLATAVITLVISCMGLFGLVTLMISKRSKEFSIHKVLGASVIQIAKLITKRFVILLTASILLTLPLGYFFLNALLDGVYKYHMPLSAFPFVLAAMIVLLTAFLTIVSQVYKAAVRDPIDAIRYE
jgi:ABC-type antimicrobial peptide transport system permease subunit